MTAGQAQFGKVEHRTGDVQFHRLGRQPQRFAHLPVALAMQPNPHEHFAAQPWHALDQGNQ
ncbi:hypothetical protein D3C80_2043840 [compost metagenome]